MEAVTIVGGLTIATGLGLGIGVGARLLRIQAEARRDLKRSRRGREEPSESRLDLEKQITGTFRSDGRKRDSSIADQAIRNQDAYAGVMKEANNARAGDFIKAANTGADISSAGARRGYGITVGGYNQAYNLALQGNDINFKGTLKGAEKVRDAAVEAARLRSVAAVVSSVGHNIARDMEQGLTLRY